MYTPSQLDILVESVWETLSLPEIAAANLNNWADRESLGDSLTQGADDAIEVLPLATILSIIAEEPSLYSRPVTNESSIATFARYLLLNALQYRLFQKAARYNADFKREQFDAEQEMLGD